MKVTLLQPSTFWEDIEKNFLLFERLFSEMEQITDLVVLPEMFPTGFTMNPEKFGADELNKVPRWLQKMSDKYDFAIAGSSIACDEERYYNRFYFATPQHDISFYDKRHLFRMGEEQNHYSAGSERKIFEYKSWRILPQVCYDLRFPVWSRNQDDYDLLIYVANWPAVRQDAWNSLLKARAIENQSFVIGVNRTGNAPDIAYKGGSVVFSPKGEVISNESSQIPDVLYADLSMDKLKSFRAKFPVWKDRDDFKINDFNNPLKFI
ncbi:amidohydrolase [Marinilabilia sp.]|uniref:amidohydrolase n=1 Tax=Marinilabilia sp. TaxID=2021252 RepID=UPI0025C2B755|nr:amidohydrolase [Marinilabilia sp.]